MKTWAPLWSGIVDSSIWSESDLVVKIFVTMLALKDSDHIVRLTAYEIGQRSRKNELEVLEALKILSSPDTKRIEPQPYEGRRIKAVEDGWLILNGELYRNKVSEEMRKARNRKAQDAFRKRQKGAQPTEEFQDDPPESITKSTRQARPTRNDLISVGLPESEAEKFLNHYNSCGWVIGKNKPMKDWKSAARGWLSRSGQYSSGKTENPASEMTEEEILKYAMQ